MEQRTQSKNLNTCENEDIAVNDTVTKLLTFHVDDQLFAIPCSQVVEIMSMQKITYMPKLPLYVKGITNIRGKIVPLVELRIRFQKEPLEYDERTCIVITEVDECCVGYIVDQVQDMTDVMQNEISVSPRISDACAEYISGVAQVNDSIALILDISKINGEHI